jgi:hypothetical protein
MLTYLPALGFRPKEGPNDCPPSYEYFVRPSRLGALHLCVKDQVRFELHVGNVEQPLLSWAGPAAELQRVGHWLRAHGL